MSAAAPLGPAAPAELAAQCGLPDVRPLWIEYAEGTVTFRNEIFGRPGVVAATSGVVQAAELRAKGAQTVYWWMKLNRIAGTPAKPTDPAIIPGLVDEVVTKAAAATECATPVVVLNELNSAGSTTAWTPTNAQYRANVLDTLRQLNAKGALPLLLISARPYTGGEALDWWLRASEVSYLVREVYFPAPPVMRSGVTIGSRTMRQRFRDGVAPLTAIGIRPERLGLVLGFQSGIGKGGREGLQPTTSWLRFVKLATMAAKQVAGELKLGTVVSWGWGTFDQAGADVDKPKAACAYLWARDASLCDAPAMAGSAFNASRDEGQIALSTGVRCTVDGSPIRTSDVAALTAVTGDADVALAALFARTVERPGHPVSTARVLEMEESVITVRFRGNRRAYEAALRARGATVAIAREVIADQLRRQAISNGLRVTAPTSAEIGLYYTFYGSLPVREIRADRAPSWLGGRRRGFALVPPGPGELLSLPSNVRAHIVTTTGPIAVTPLDEVLPLGVVPASMARGAVRAALTTQARIQAFQSWTIRAQSNALSRIRCLRDALPPAATVDLGAYLPFLTLYT